MPRKKQKQSSKSAFYYFMMDFRQLRGNAFRTMQQVSEAAGLHWERMSREERRPYEEKALFEKNNVRPGKLTSDGLSVEVLERLEKEHTEKIKQMKYNIHEELNLATTDGNIKEKMLFLVHFNCFCYCISEKRHYPAEMAIVRFNLVDGVQPENVYHSIISPGLLPLGYASEALRISNETHQIPLPFGEIVENNMEQVYNAIKQFLQTKVQGSETMPVLYCHEREMKMVQNILDMWRNLYNDDTVFNVYNLQYMFHVLKNAVAGNAVWPSETFSYMEIEKDVNAFSKGIACDYHHQTSIPVHCSRSKVIRYAYTICDNCCKDLHIPLILGCHVPQMELVVSSRPSSSTGAMSRSSRKARSIKSVREDDRESVVSLSLKSDLESHSVTSEVSTFKSDFDFLDAATGQVNDTACSMQSVREDDRESVISFSTKSDLESRSGISDVLTITDDVTEGERQDRPCDTNPRFSLDTPSSSKSEAGASGIVDWSFRPFDHIAHLASRTQNISFTSRICPGYNLPSDSIPKGAGRGARKKTRNVPQPNNKD